MNRGSSLRGHDINVMDAFSDTLTYIFTLICEFSSGDKIPVCNKRKGLEKEKTNMGLRLPITIPWMLDVSSVVNPHTRAVA